MKKLNKNQSGFGITEIILVIVVVILLGVVGYLVFRNQNKTASTNSSAATTNGPNAKTTSPAKAQTKLADSSYLVITEWNVELPLATGIKDAYYAELKRNTFSYPVYALGIKSLDALDPNCAAQNLSVSIILRQSIAEHDTNSTKADPNNSPIYDKKVGNYYYGYDRSRAACSNNQKAIDLQLAAFDLFKTAFEGLKAIN